MLNNVPTHVSTRRHALRTLGAVAVTAMGAPVLAQTPPIRIGVIAPRGGVMGTVGECGLRGMQWATNKLNAANGIGGRKIELIVEEETTPKDTIERFRKLVLSDKVDTVHGIVSTGVSLALAPAAEDSRVPTIFWDGTTQDGVKETMPKPRFVFRSNDNECEAVMSSLLAIKHFKGQFVTIAGINPDYSYGRNNWAAFQALLKKFGIEHRVVSEQWSKVGNLNLTSNVAALKAAKPDLIFSSLLFADLPVFMKQAHEAGLSQGTKFVLPAAGWQHTGLKKEFMPEGVILGHNTLYFNDPKASPLQKEFVQWYADQFKDYPHWEADRAYFSLQVYKAGVEKAMAAKGGAWPNNQEIAAAMAGVEVMSLGGKGGMRADHIADQTFHQGLSTNKNNYDFPTLASVDTMYSTQIQKPAGTDFWEWLKTADIKL
ncbi:ABC transporter substrate-binding protein [Hydrogenophaga laconesensis]|uniref:Branched-chain amino acid transport system substrate-binding protein n=1 Tax=Hydrogenophaga laconesensis TaxID=1805971 RepID=A0ABU1V7X7_9BURK|nr:ABC transporter substrate-binding protein [Hydrogenophaga laconesensis]MDR7093558.1 branched-chain amino acid transport system substrate-binding protein [Hydrogenophaga laconesensis]